jgi:hypothetical protein
MTGISRRGGGIPAAWVAALAACCAILAVDGQQEAQGMPKWLKTGKGGSVADVLKEYSALQTAVSRLKAGKQSNLMPAAAAGGTGGISGGPGPGEGGGERQASMEKHEMQILGKAMGMSGPLTSALLPSSIQNLLLNTVAMANPPGAMAAAGVGSSAMHGMHVAHQQQQLQQQAGGMANALQQYQDYMAKQAAVSQQYQEQQRQQQQQYPQYPQQQQQSPQQQQQQQQYIPQQQQYAPAQPQGPSQAAPAPSQRGIFENAPALVNPHPNLDKEIYDKDVKFLKQLAAICILAGLALVGLCIIKLCLCGKAAGSKGSKTAAAMSPQSTPGKAAGVKTALTGSEAGNAASATGVMGVMGGMGGFGEEFLGEIEKDFDAVLGSGKEILAGSMDALGGAADVVGSALGVVTNPIVSAVGLDHIEVYDVVVCHEDEDGACGRAGATLLESILERKGFSVSILSAGGGPMGSRDAVEDTVAACLTLHCSLFIFLAGDKATQTRPQTEAVIDLARAATSFSIRKKPAVFVMSTQGLGNMPRFGRRGWGIGPGNTGQLPSLTSLSLIHPPGQPPALSSPRWSRIDQTQNSSNRTDEPPSIRALED